MPRLIRAVSGTKRLLKSPATSYQLLIIRKKGVNVLLNQDLAQQTEENRKKLKSIISTIIICAIHGLPLRGKTDKTAVFNDLLKFRQEADDLVLLHHLRKTQAMCLIGLKMKLLIFVPHP